jgi:8-oxo-dGTP diphosphatase
MQKVSAAVIEIGNFFLICRRHRSSRRFPFKWEFPGGKVEAGETPVETVVREIREELGIIAHGPRPLKDYPYRYGNEDTVHLYFFSVPAFDNTVKNLQFDSLAWVPAEKLHCYDMLAGDRKVVRMLEKRTGRRKGKPPCVNSEG